MDIAQSILGGPRITVKARTIPVSIDQSEAKQSGLSDKANKNVMILKKSRYIC